MGGEEAVDRNGEDKPSIGDQRSFREFWGYNVIVLKMTRLTLQMKDNMLTCAKLREKEGRRQESWRNAHHPQRSITLIL